MSEVLKSPGWQEIEANVDRQYRRHRRAVLGISVLAALQSVVPAAKLSETILTTQWNEIKNGLVLMQRYPQTTAAPTPEPNPLFDPQTPALVLTQAEVDAVLDIIQS